MNMSPLQAAFTGINQVRGPVVPVTMFMEVSAYPSAEAAMTALQRAKQELAEAKDRLQVLKIEQARIMRTGDAPSIEYDAYSFEDECDYASHHVRHCHEEVWRVEQAMGLFHPKHRALLAGWVKAQSAFSTISTATQTPKRSPLKTHSLRTIPPLLRWTVMGAM